MNQVLEVKLKLPRDFTEEIEGIYNKKVSEKIFKGICEEKVQSFRVNYLKSNENEVEEELLKNNINFNKIKLFDSYVYILEKGDLSRLDIFKNGCIYMQSISSMIPAFILNPKENENIADISAAPRK